MEENPEDVESTEEPEDSEDNYEEYIPEFVEIDPIVAAEYGLPAED
jgi:hypothetical protein